ncbi:family 16 glycosylhydrolase [Mariniblastus fucicola]|uniref:Beta-glucanase n=1 Tax=Mariniblastus fucicola TaxID=980251 RepID=A0A5B9PDQ2_9BACT|nr:family 16 glycosylhydrolase [Mariniblastus fucicola]QEG23619.1 Beta-glucanase precursor [Mariniblastus fucicola]
MLNFRLATLSAVCAVAVLSQNSLLAQSVSIPDAPMTVVAGQKIDVPVEFEGAEKDILQVQLFDSSWKKVSEGWVNVDSASGTHTFAIDVPADTAAGKGHMWQALLYDNAWKKKKDVLVTNVVVTAAVKGGLKPDSKMKLESEPKAKPKPKKDPKSIPHRKAQLLGDEWLPVLENGKWEIDWADEFDGEGEPEKWFPLLGYDPEAYKAADAKGIRWTGGTEETAWMYSTRSGNHWQNGKGQLVMQIVTNKKESNEMGPKVEAAYLLSGRPVAWDSNEPNGAKWDGKFVSPTEETPLYICARVKSDELVGYSTWFAFWLFTETRAYNGNPTDGTEVDVVEIVKGKKNYLNHCFNVANHWKKGGGSESKQFNTLSKPAALDLVDVTDSEYHVYGIEWTTEKMTCFVDGKPYYTFTENIPTKPVDMMMLLTLEFQKDAWDPDQGDGRVEGPAVSEDENTRVMSKVLVDYVRVYKKK